MNMEVFYVRFNGWIGIVFYVSYKVFRNNKK